MAAMKTLAEPYVYDISDSELLLELDYAE